MRLTQYYIINGIFHTSNEYIFLFK